MHIKNKTINIKLTRKAVSSVTTMLNIFWRIRDFNIASFRNVGKELWSTAVRCEYVIYVRK